MAKQAQVDTDSAVFTIPINFSGKARKVLRKSANTAGIEVISFIHEPFAAIVGSIFTDKNSNYNTPQDRINEMNNQNVLVFDFGGGTLDITVVKIENGKMLEMGTSEMTGQAGDKFDELIANMVWNNFVNEYSKVHTSDEFNIVKKKKWKRLLAIAEDCKIKLSTEKSVDFILENVTGLDESIIEEITRENFEELLTDILHKVDTTIDKALSYSGMCSNDINTVLLTGGTCEIPAIQNLLSDKFGGRVKKAENSALVIAQGAAVIAEMGWLPFLTKDIRVLLCDDSYWPMFENGQPLSPKEDAKNSEVFTCVDQRNNRAKIIVNEGIGQELGRNLCLLNVPVLGDNRFGDDIIVESNIDNNIILNVTACSKLVTDYNLDIPPQPKSAEIYELCFGLDTNSN